jgi:hypothetical protein
MKRFLLACVGMVLLGTAGLLILHQVVEFPSAVVAQSGGVPAGGPGVPGAGGEPRRAAEPGQYKDIVPALVDALADADGGVRQLAAATLIKIGPDAVTPLVEALKSKDRETRANAAYVLGHLGQPAHEALPALAKALKDEDKEVRRRVAYALHNIVGQRETRVPGAPVAGEPPVAEAAGDLLASAPLRLAGAGGPPMLGMQAPLDPGLLLPAASPPAKPEKKPPIE